MVTLLQPGLARIALNDYRLGHILEAPFAANLNKVYGAIALKALEVYALPTPWLHQDTTTIALYARMQTSRRVRRRLTRPTAIAKMGVTIANRCC